jgi:L-alanine-DL-glutamate epimerase-like enolase superfamily enzyme
MAEVARRSPVPIATGESLHNKQQFEELLELGVVSIYQPEPLLSRRSLRHPEDLRHD